MKLTFLMINFSFFYSFNKKWTGVILRNQFYVTFSIFLTMWICTMQASPANIGISSLVIIFRGNEDSIEILNFVKQCQSKIKIQHGRKSIGKKHAFKKYDQFILNPSCSNTISKITSAVLQFHEIFSYRNNEKLNYFNYCY